jgi:hypothetical protein
MVGLLLAGRAQAGSGVIGSLANFDVVNDTGQPAGLRFEIEMAIRASITRSSPASQESRRGRLPSSSLLARAARA